MSVRARAAPPDAEKYLRPSRHGIPKAEHHGPGIRIPARCERSPHRQRSQTPLHSVIDADNSVAQPRDSLGPTSSSLARADRDEMTHITEARVITNHAGMGRSAPAATNRPYLTVGEVLRAGMCRTAGRKEMAAAKSTWDSEGGATDQ